MPLQVDISGDCSSLTIVGGTDYAGAGLDIYWNDVSAVSIPYDATLFTPITTLDASGSLTLTIANFVDAAGDSTTTYTHFNGIFKIVVTVPGATSTDPDTVYELGAVGMCDINCCLGAKTKELLKCKCGDCKECVAILSDITKIYLLLNGAKVNVAGCVQTTTLYEKSIDEYLKAKSICGTENCICNC